MGERVHDAGMLLPHEPWHGSVEATPRPVPVVAVELGTLAIGMGSLFWFGLGLGSSGDVSAVPLVTGAMATAAVFLLPDVVQRRFAPATRVPAPAPKPVTYSESRLFEQWPSRAVADLDEAAIERRAS